MIAAEYDFQARVTEPFYLELLFGITDEDGTDLGPIDFTGEDIRMHVRQRVEDSRTVLELSTGNGRIIVMTPGSGVDANLALSVPIQIMAPVRARRYYYDLRYWQGPVLLTGTLTLVGGVTR